MARRRSGAAGGWTVKRYRSPLWKYVHPVAYLKGEARRARRQMAPGKVLGRYFSVPEIKSAVGTKTVRVTADTRRRQAATAEKRASRPAPAKKSAAKSRRPDPYAAALAIPAQNRAVAAKMAKAAQPAKRAVAVRKKDGSGRFDGRKVMAPYELDAYTAAQHAPTDPALFTRNLRGRRTQ